MTRQLTAVALAALILTPAAAFAQASTNLFTDAVKAQLAQIKAPITPLPKRSARICIRSSRRLTSAASAS